MQAVKLFKNVYVCPILYRNAIQLKARESLRLVIIVHVLLCTSLQVTRILR